MEQLDLFEIVPSKRPAFLEPHPLPVFRVDPNPPVAIDPAWDRSPPPPRVVPLALSAAAFTWPAQMATILKPLRDYQAEARGNIHAHFPLHRRALVVSATGSGKTVLFAAIAADVLSAGGRVLILTDQFELVDQALEKLQAVAGIYAGAEQADRTAGLAARVVVATVQSLGTRLRHWPQDHFALVVCDECDRAVAPMWQKVLKHFDGHARVLGVTATPKRSDKKCILKYFETKIFDLGLLELINRGYLVPVNVRELPINIDLRAAEDATSEKADYDADAVGAAVVAVFGEVAQAIKEHAPHLKTLVFCPDVATSKKFAATAQLAGLNCRHVDGESHNRKELKMGFRDWRPGNRDPRNFNVLVNPILLGRGYDDPSIGCVVNLRPTKSISLYQQIIGRGTRLFCPHGCFGVCDHPDKKRELLVLDFLYQFKSMGPIRPAHLFTDKPEKIEAMQAVISEAQGALDLRTVMAMAEKKMEEALLKAVEEALRKTKGGKGEYYNAMQFAATLQLPDILDYEPETEDEARAVPAKLQKRLSKAGFIPESVPYYGLAMRVLAAVEARRQAGYASVKQVFWLRKWGYRDALEMSREQASAICARKFSSRF